MQLYSCKYSRPTENFKVFNQGPNSIQLFWPKGKYIPNFVSFEAHLSVQLGWGKLSVLSLMLDFCSVKMPDCNGMNVTAAQLNGYQNLKFWHVLSPLGLKNWMECLGLGNLNNPFSREKASKRDNIKNQCYIMLSSEIISHYKIFMNHGCQRCRRIAAQTMISIRNLSLKKVSKIIDSKINGVLYLIWSAIIQSNRWMDNRSERVTRI